MFNILKIASVEEDKSKYDISVSNIEYEILDNKHRVLVYNKKLNNSANENTKYNLLETIDNLSFTETVLKDNIPKNQELIFKIKYKNLLDEWNEIIFKFKLLKKYTNVLSF